MADIQTQLPVRITDGTNTVIVTPASALKVDNSGVTQTVAGTVTSNAGTGTFNVQGVAGGTPLPVSMSGTISTAPSGTQAVSGSVTTTPSGTGTQTIAGAVTVTSGTITTTPSGTQTVAGSVLSTPSEISTGVIAFYGTSTAVAVGSVGTITYTVSTGKTLYLKGVIASSSGGPCKVSLTTGSSSPVTFAVGFYSTASPFIEFTFPQPIPIAAGTAVNVQIMNNTLLPMDVYGFINGREM